MCYYLKCLFFDIGIKLIKFCVSFTSIMGVAVAWQLRVCQSSPPKKHLPYFDYAQYKQAGQAQVVVWVDKTMLYGCTLLGLVQGTLRLLLGRLRLAHTPT